MHRLGMKDRLHIAVETAQRFGLANLPVKTEFYLQQSVLKSFGLGLARARPDGGFL